MVTLTHPAEAAVWSAEMRRLGRQVGFVPTMGALHLGHMSLIHRAKSDGMEVAASVFVNPFQFNNPADLARYPRQLDQDRDLLEAAGCSMLFAPTTDLIYAGHGQVGYDLGGLDHFLEGPLRPGHFQGVVNVVERLFHFVRPDRAYFGEKDRQQLAIVQYVVVQQRWPVTIVACPTQREADGLAMSSRNQQLSGKERAVAGTLFKALQKLEDGAFNAPVADCLLAGKAVIAAEPLFTLEYLEVADPGTLAPLMAWSERDEAVALVAARLGTVRLIDNITLRR